MIVFSKQWFNKYSKVITFIARFPFIGELIFNFKKFGHYVDRNKIVEVTPNSVIELVKRKGKKVELKQHFFIRNEYALRLQSVFYPIWITFHIWDIITRPIPQLNLGFDTLTVYPDTGNPGTDTVDGIVGRSGVDEAWSTIYSSAGNSVDGTSANPTIISLRASSTSNQFQHIYRGIFHFDTSSLTSGATISATVLSLFGSYKQDNLSATPNINIYTSTVSSDNTLVDTDFSQVGSTAQSDTAIAYADWSITGYNDFTFNATGRGNVSKTGVSKFSTRNVNYDVANFAPAWSSNAQSAMWCNTADAGSNKPKLVITYTVASGPTKLKTWNGLAKEKIKTINSLDISKIKSINGLN